MITKLSIEAERREISSAGNFSVDQYQR